MSPNRAIEVKLQEMIDTSNGEFDIESAREELYKEVEEFVSVECIDKAQHYQIVDDVIDACDWQDWLDNRREQIEREADPDKWHGVHHADFR